MVKPRRISTRPYVGCQAVVPRRETAWAQSEALYLWTEWSLQAADNTRYHRYLPLCELVKSSTHGDYQYSCNRSPRRSLLSTINALSLICVLTPLLAPSAHMSSCHITRKQLGECTQLKQYSWIAIPILEYYLSLPILSYNSFHVSMTQHIEESQVSVHNTRSNPCIPFVTPHRLAWLSSCVNANERWSTTDGPSQKCNQHTWFLLLTNFLAIFFAVLLFNVVW